MLSGITKKEYINLPTNFSKVWDFEKLIERRAPILAETE
jgi:hypothetical protein